jgi:hypothetical protein
LGFEATTEPLKPNTTLQQDLTHAGQRKINLVWEITQSVIAIVVVAANVIVGVHLGLTNSSASAPPVLTNSLFLVIGFYFARTNHSAIGGVGPQPYDEYRGR